MQSVEERLDSINETVIEIPFGGSDDEPDTDDERYYNAKEALRLSVTPEDDAINNPRSERNARNSSRAEAQSGVFPVRMYTPPELTHRDLPEGPFMRMAAYEHSWGRIRDRILGILREVRTEVTERVVNAVRDSYTPKEEDRLMPFTELLALTVSGSDRGSTAALLADVRDSLLRPVLYDRNLDEDEDAVDAEDNGEPLACISTVEASDCSSITSTMRTLIGGFVRSDGDAGEASEDEDDRSWRLAPYDINLLVQWYKKLQVRKVGSEPQKLVVLIPELEKVDPAIMRDVFYISGTYSTFLFILGLSTPPHQSYLHSAYPRATLALLQVTRFEAPAGPEILERVLVDTFFDPEFEPDVMPSGVSLAFLHEHFMRTAQSMDFVMTLLQLFLLRHFTEPLTVLTVNTLLGQSTEDEAVCVLEKPEAKMFLVTLYVRLKAVENDSSKTSKSNGNEDIDDSAGLVVAESSSDDEILMSGTPTRRRFPQTKSKGSGETGTLSLASPLSILQTLEDVSASHRKRLRRLRLAFRLPYTLRTHLFRAGVLRPTMSDRLSRYRSAEYVETEERIKMMGSILKGRVGEKEGKRLCEGVSKLDLGAIDELLGSLMPLTKTAAASLEGEAKDAFETQMEGWNARLREQAAGDGLEEDETSLEVLREMAEWAVKYALVHAFDVTEGRLWDLWVTASPSSVTDLFNPNPRAAIINALVHPERYLKSVSGTVPQPSTSPSTMMETPRARGRGRGGGRGRGRGRVAASSSVKAPSQHAPEEEAEDDFITDASLLFHGYQAGGRMLNVYDWYASFKEALDGQRRAARKAVRSQNLTNGGGMRNKLKGKGKGKEKQRVEESDADAEDEVMEALLASPSKRGRGRGRGRGSGRARGRGRGNGNASGRGSGRAAVGVDGSASRPDHSLCDSDQDGADGERDHGGENEAAGDDANHDDERPASDSDSESAESLEGEEREKWEEEVQVRFIRGVHELDLLGFVKHTGRRGEHVVKTVFEPLEDV